MDTSTTTFKQHIDDGYTFKKDYVVMGTAIHNGEPSDSTHVKLPLKTLNRHGLIAGATGTGKTKTLQVMAEQFSLKGIPCLMMDLKGDLSGLAQPGSLNDHIIWRQGKIGLPYVSEPMPVELLTLSDEPGTRLRATISEFGPVLLSKILGLNDVQEGIMSIIFKYCDDNKMALLDIKDLKKVLQYTINEGQEEIEKEYGRISSASVSTIQRKIIAIEQQGADRFFGERSFDIDDLMRTENGKGVISIIRLTDIQDRPKLFSTFMLSLLAEVYSTLPEQGDDDKPELCIFIDEAHLVFKEANSALMDQIEAIVKLIRSKGVGLFFCTQDPTDVPDAVLGQLGLKVQHALRAFTAKDRKAIKRTAENYPDSPFYDTAETLTQLGIGEAFITALNEKGIPTPLAATLLQAPKTRMDILTDKEIKSLVKGSEIAEFYNEEIDRESAFEILNEKIERAQSEEHQKQMEEQQEKARESLPKARRGRPKKETSIFEKASKNTLVRQVGRTIFRELTRGLLGALGVKKRR